MLRRVPRTAVTENISTTRKRQSADVVNGSVTAVIHKGDISFMVKEKHKNGVKNGDASPTRHNGDVRQPSVTSPKLVTHHSNGQVIGQHKSWYTPEGK